MPSKTTTTLLPPWPLSQARPAWVNCTITTLRSRTTSYMSASTAAPSTVTLATSVGSRRGSIGSTTVYRVNTASSAMRGMPVVVGKLTVSPSPRPACSETVLATCTARVFFG